MQCYRCPFLHKEMFSYARCLLLNKKIVDFEHDKCYVDEDRIKNLIEMLREELVKRNIKNRENKDAKCKLYSK